MSLSIELDLSSEIDRDSFSRLADDPDRGPVEVWEPVEAETEADETEGRHVKYGFMANA